jgi:hypothetical protein
MITVEPAIRVDPFFRKSLEVCQLLWLYFNHVNIEIVSLGMDRHGCGQAHDDYKCPNGSPQHDCLLRLRDSGKGIEADATPGDGRCQDRVLALSSGAVGSTRYVRLN